ncbi:restriction endonuclease subunit S [Sulfuricurvum sp.]|uniref:restriction endonuclease subunit S n=1 Tax=Sulfuricurvum sp. TaxID=2025608 RepID=UPI003BAE390B
MSSQWPEVVVKEVCESVVDCVNKTAPVVDYITPYRMIRTTNVKNGTVNLEGARYVTQEVYEKWTRRVVPQYGDVILTREAPLGEVGMLKSNEKIFLGQRLMQYRANPEKLNNHFLLYALQESFMQGQIRASGSGSTVEHMRVGDAENLKIKLPHIEVQHKIASILSAYDDLIENNNRRIVILEEMARSLYREWFVKFRFPGHEEVKMVDSELGQIPEGWSILKVDQLVDFHIGGGWGQEKPDEKHSQPAYVIRGTDINHVTHGNSSVIPYRFHSVSNLKSRKLEIGDIVFEVSGGSKGQPVGRALLVSKKLLNNLHEDVMCASFCKLIRGNNIVPAEYFYLHLKEIYDNGQIDKYQVQSTGITNFKFQVFLEQETVLIPPEAILKKFIQPIQSFFDQINVLGFKNLNLKTQRDMLLPKLISGKIPVI